MKLSTARLAVTAGLTAMLALGGCSVTSKTETTTSVSDGESTTTTTTTTENGETTTTETKTTDGADSTKVDDITKADSYDLEAFGLHYNLPDGFKFTQATLDQDLLANSVIAFNAEADDGVVYMKTFPLEQRIDVHDETFLDEQKAEVEKVFTNVGSKSDSMEVNTLDFPNGSSFPVISATGTMNGEAVVLNNLYFTLNDNDGHYALVQLIATAQTPERAQEMIKGLTMDAE